MSGGTLKKRTCFSLWLALCISVGSSAFGATESARELLASNITKSVVSIHATRLDPFYLQPWTTVFGGTASGSGVILQDGNILTNAHVVSHAKHIEVRPHGKSKWQTAEVLYISHEMDLALLKVPGSRYHEHGLGLVIGELPSRFEEISVLGFPVGGAALSITKGVVSRLEHTSYAHSNVYLFAGQIDAAINPGNSGGPIIVDGKIVGIVMQLNTGLQNTGYFVPPPMIKHFLHDVQDGKLSGLPWLNIDDQSITNHAIRAQYSIPASLEGRLVYAVSGSAAHHLAVGDVIVSIEDHAIDSDGNVEFRPGEMTGWGFYLDLKQLGETLSITVFRDKKLHQLQFPLSESAADIYVVPVWDYDQMPRYFIYNGLVFSPLTRSLMETRYPEDGEDAPAHLQKYSSKSQSKDRQEIAVVLYVLAHPVNEGYHSLDMEIVQEVNGVPIYNFQQFYDLIHGTEDPFLMLKSEDKEQILINTAEAQRTHQEILASYQIEHGESMHFRTQVE